MTKGNRILIVDDEQHITDFYATVLNTEGYGSLCVDSAEAALKILENQPVDLLITDMKMPGMNGLELLEEVSDRYPGMQRVLISGAFGTGEQMSSLQDNGLVDRVLAKPCGIDELIATVAALLPNADTHADSHSAVA